MDLSELYQTYTRVPKNLATPKQLFKIVAYAAINGIYSNRKIEAACRQNINYMSKVAELIEVYEEVYDIRVAYNDRISLGTIKQLVIQLEKLCRKERVVFVSGTRKKKTPLQRSVEQARNTCRGWRIMSISSMYAGTATVTPKRTMTRPL